METQKAWTELTRSGIKLSLDGKTFGFPDAFDDPTPIVFVKGSVEEQDNDDESPGELTVYTREKIALLLISAYDRGYKQALEILQP